MRKENIFSEMIIYVAISCLHLFFSHYITECPVVFIFFLFLFRVIDGLETLDELEKLPVKPKTFQPLTDTRLNSVTIHANPFAK